MLRKEYLHAWEENKRRGNHAYSLILNSVPLTWSRDVRFIGNCFHSWLKLHFRDQKIIHFQYLEWFKKIGLDKLFVVMLILNCSLTLVFISNITYWVLVGKENFISDDWMTFLWNSLVFIKDEAVYLWCAMSAVCKDYLGNWWFTGQKLYKLCG